MRLLANSKAKKFFREPKERRGLSNKGINMLHIIFRGDRSSIFNNIGTRKPTKPSIEHQETTNSSPRKKVISPLLHGIPILGITSTERLGAKFKIEQNTLADPNTDNWENGMRKWVRTEHEEDVMSYDIEAIENVIENESHFSLEVVDQDLIFLAMFTKHLMGKEEFIGGIGGGSFSKHSMVAKDGLGGDGFIVEGERSPSTSSKDEEDGGVANKSSIGSRLVATSEIVVERLLEKLVELRMSSSMEEKMVDKEEKKFLDW
ncbi:hypothetical protein Tco_0876927 [Tanacetum coccineum]|uniref:Uncharacterized protein n=1 Tax=Tanacetum coccineum TaxID=301880 RepID=A0ABQ5BTX1_9ASTR